MVTVDKINYWRCPECGVLLRQLTPEENKLPYTGRIPLDLVCTHEMMRKVYSKDS